MADGMDLLVAGLWRASWQASILAGLVLMVQWLLRERLSARWRYRLWMLVLIRLALPVTPSSPMSLFNLAPVGEGTARSVEAPLVFEAVDMPAVSAASPGSATVWKEAFEVRERHGWEWGEVAATGWACGVVVLGMRLAWVSGVLWWRMRRVKRVEDEALHGLVVECARELGTRALPVYSADWVVSPALVGCVRPRLLLPGKVLQAFKREELRLIVLHELAHHRRRDVPAAWGVALLQILHWFNPVVWWVMRRVRVERELACDEMVLATVREADQRCYGRVIVKLLENLAPPPPQPGVMGIVENGSQIKRRITMIACFSSNRRRWTGVAVGLVVLLSCVALTDATDKSQPPATGPAPQQPPAPELDQMGTPGMAQGMGTDPGMMGMDPGMGMMMDPDPMGMDPGMGMMMDPDMMMMMGPSMGVASPQPDPQVQQQLQRELPDVRFADVSLEDVLEFVRDVTSLNIVVDWRSLEAAGIDRRTPVSIRLRNVPAGQALRLVLRDLGLVYTVEGRVVIVTTSQPAQAKRVTRAYDVGELVGAGDNEARSRRMEELKSVVASATQNATAVTVASFGSKLVVTAPQSIQQQVAEVLELLRAQPATQQHQPQPPMMDMDVPQPAF